MTANMPYTAMASVAWPDGNPVWLIGREFFLGMAVPADHHLHHRGDGHRPATRQEEGEWFPPPASEQGDHCGDQHRQRDDRGGGTGPADVGQQRPAVRRAVAAEERADRSVDVGKGASAERPGQRPAHQAAEDDEGDEHHQGLAHQAPPAATGGRAGHHRSTLPQNGRRARRPLEGAIRSKRSTTTRARRRRRGPAPRHQGRRAAGAPDVDPGDSHRRHQTGEPRAQGGPGLKGSGGEGRGDAGVTRQEPVAGRGLAPHVGWDELRRPASADRPLDDLGQDPGGRPRDQQPLGERLVPGECGHGGGGRNGAEGTELHHRPHRAVQAVGQPVDGVEDLDLELGQGELRGGEGGEQERADADGALSTGGLPVQRRGPERRPPPTRTQPNRLTGCRPQGSTLEPPPRGPSRRHGSGGGWR